MTTTNSNEQWVYKQILGKSILWIAHKIILRGILWVGFFYLIGMFVYNLRTSSTIEPLARLVWGIITWLGFLTWTLTSINIDNESIYLEKRIKWVENIRKLAAEKVDEAFRLGSREGLPFEQSIVEACDDILKSLKAKLCKARPRTEVTN